MNLRKLPPSMLLALGLACGDDEGTDTAVDGCLSPSPATGVSACLDVGPCLSDETALPPVTGTDTGTGTSTDTGTGTGTDTGTSTGTGTGTDTSSSEGSSGSDVSTGPCLVPVEMGTSSGPHGGLELDTHGPASTAPPASRAAAVDRVLERGTLPPDVAARLRRTTDD